jgi:hypothetical protein
VAFVVLPAAAQASWGPPNTVDPGQQIFGVSCASASFCVATDTGGNVLTYDGTTWSAPNNVDSELLISVSCTSASFCVAIDSGGGNVLTYDGSTWSGATNIGTNLYSVSCPSASFCAVVDGQGNAYTYDGSTWSAPTSIDSGADLLSVSCPSASFCAAVDTSGNVLTYDGSTWSAPTNIDSTVLQSVSCPSSSFCAAVDNNGYALTYSGGTWSAPTKIDPRSFPLLTSVSCTSSSFCEAVDFNGNAFNYDGSAWSAPNNIASGFAWLGEGTVSCPSSSFCAAGSNSGQAVTGTDPFVSAGPSTVVWDSVNAASLVLGDVSTVVNASTNLGAVDTTDFYTVDAPTADNTGSGAGWRESLTQTLFTQGAGADHPGKTLGVSSPQVGSPTDPAQEAVTSVAVTDDANSTNTEPTGVISSEAALTPDGSTPTVYVDNGTDNGMGNFDIQPTVTVAVPANTYEGVYSATATISLVSGP